MSLLKLRPIPKSEFDPVAEARGALEYYELNEIALEAYVVGSAASDHFSQESDIDIVVIFPDLKTIEQAREHLSREPFSEWPFDWIFKTRKDFDQRSSLGGVCYMAKETGVKIL